VELARCPNCKQPVPAGARFCPACGTTLAARVDAAERRVVTAIFADLAGSTRLGEQLDPEILRQVVSEFFEIAGREIRGHGGTVEQFSGDAAVGVFGLTSSHEDDPERAVRTAFAIVKAAPETGDSRVRPMAKARRSDTAASGTEATSRATASSAPISWVMPASTARLRGHSGAGSRRRQR
jgi:class 3 adenylate cyclase